MWGIGTCGRGRATTSCAFFSNGNITANVNNSGQFNAGLSPGTTVNGNYTQNSGSTLVAEIEAILGLRPELGTLKERAQALEQDVRALTVVEENARLGLTPAERRLLPLLATHLSFREIAEQLEVSRNTVKTQAISIYRKLGVSGRSDAVGAAALVDPTRVAGA